MRTPPPIDELEDWLTRIGPAMREWASHEREGADGLVLTVLVTSRARTILRDWNPKLITAEHWTYRMAILTVVQRAAIESAGGAPGDMAAVYVEQEAAVQLANIEAGLGDSERPVTERL